MSNWNTRSYKLSINQRLINNNERDDVQAFVEGFENQQLTLDQFANSIQNGFAYCAQLSGLRNVSNFMCTDLVSVNIDGTRTIEEVQNDELFRKSATLFYTTTSHKADDHHFRIIFGLEDTIKDARRIVALSRGLALHFNGDGSVIDAARLFYGNTNAETSISCKGLSNLQIDELIKHGKSSDQTDYVLNNSATIQSTRTIDPDQPILRCPSSTAHKHLSRMADHQIKRIDGK